MLAEMTRPRLGNYGLGLQIIELNGRTAYNHTGGIDDSRPTCNFPKIVCTVVVSANTENDPVKKIATEIAALALNAKRLTTPRKLLKPPHSRRHLTRDCARSIANGPATRAESGRDLHQSSAGYGFVVPRGNRFCLLFHRTHLQVDFSYCSETKWTESGRKSAHRAFPVKLTRTQLFDET